MAPGQPYWPGTASAPVGHASQKKFVLALTHPPSGVAASNEDKRSKEFACACAIAPGPEPINRREASAKCEKRWFFLVKAGMVFSFLTLQLIFFMFFP